MDKKLKREISRVFDKDGNFTFSIHDIYNDPRARVIFDEEGHMHHEVWSALPKMIEAGRWAWNCHAVKYYYAARYAMSLKGSYPATLIDR